jgi:predicted amidophosphoribosyltransferase
VLSTFKSLAQLIYPPFCLLCKNPHESLCSTCLLQWQQPIKQKFIEGVPLYFSNYYDEKGARLILAAKESGNLAARNLLALSIHRGLQQFITDFKISNEIGLIGIPSRTSINRVRGRAHIDDLINSIIDIPARNNLKQQLQRLDILKIVKKIKDQSGLNKVRRSTNMSGAYLAIHPEVSIKNLVIIDDLTTTGASIRAAISALSIVNLRPVAVITACAVTAHL